MKEYSLLSTHEHIGTTVDTLRPIEYRVSKTVSLQLGARAVGASHSVSHSGQRNLEKGASDMVSLHTTEERNTTPEGARNSELYIRAYEAAIFSIDHALHSEREDLPAAVAQAFEAIDALRTVPYIASAPEFVELVDAARGMIETVDSITRHPTNFDSAHTGLALTRAKSLLAGTLIAYRP